MKRTILTTFIALLIAIPAFSSWILLPMDETQTNHLKAYGITFLVLDKYKKEAYWLLNYKGGSFAIPYNKLFEKECLTRNVKYQVLTDGKYNAILEEIADPAVNMDAMKLDVAPKIAVYSPTINEHGDKIEKWDDAVTLVLDYAEIPYEVVYDKEILEDKLIEYNWLHLHHEDFTGQHGKLYKGFGSQGWYKKNQARLETSATELGYSKVSEMKLAVAEKIKSYVSGGGFMFAMCSATETFDVALSAHKTDICGNVHDGDGQDKDAQSKIDYSQTFAFKDFKLFLNPLEYEFSDIDNSRVTRRNITEKTDYFTLFDFSAKWDPVPTMLTQCHTRIVKGFMGQTTAFKKHLIKSEVRALGENKPANEVRYLHNEYGEGFFTFYGGHDPEDYSHRIFEEPTDLNLHPNSPGYRLILNNVLFPAAKKKKKET